MAYSKLTFECMEIIPDPPDENELKGSLPNAAYNRKLES